MDLAELRFKVDTTQLDAANKKIGELGNAVNKLGKPIQELSKASEKAAQATKKVADASEQSAQKVTKVANAAKAAGNPIEALQNRLRNTYKDLADGFTRGESSILNLARNLNATEAEMKQIQATLRDMSKLLKDPFDSAIGSVRSVTREYEMLNQRAQLAQQGISLTTKQLREFSKISDEVAGKIKAAGLDPTEGQGKVLFDQNLKAQQAEYLKTAQSVNALKTAEEERNKVLKAQGDLEKMNRTAGDAMVSQFRARQDAAIKEAEAIRRKTEAQNQYNAAYQKFISMGFANADAKRGAGMISRGVDESAVRVFLDSANAQRQAEAAAKGKEQADRKATKAAQERANAERTMGDTMVAQYRRREQSIDNELRKLREQAAALRANQAAQTGNVVNRLNNLGATPQQIEQARKLRKEIEDLGKEARRAESPLLGLQGVLRGLIPAFGALGGGALAATGLRIFVETADAIETLANRIKVLSNETVEFQPAFENLKRIADEARAPIMELGTLYSRLLPVMQSVGKDAEYAAQVTESFALAMTISGTTAQEARSGLLQFSQAMSSATFNGDEFRAISEAVPEVLRILETQLGVTRAELRRMSADGELTSDIVGTALVNSLDTLKGRVQNLPTTLQQSFTLLRNEFVVLAKNINDSMQLTQTAAKIVQDLSSILNAVNDNKDAFLGLAGAIAPIVMILGGGLALAIGGTVAKFAGASIAMLAFADSVGISKENVFLLTAAAGALTLAYAKMAVSATAATASLGLFGKAAYAAGGAVAVLYKGVLALLGLLAANPIGAAVIGFGALATAVVKYNESQKESLQVDEDLIERTIEVRKNIENLKKEYESGVLSLDQYKKKLEDTGSTRFVEGLRTQFAEIQDRKQVIEELLAGDPNKLRRDREFLENELRTLEKNSRTVFEAIQIAAGAARSSIAGLMSVDISMSRGVRNDEWQSEALNQSANMQLKLMGLEQKKLDIYVKQSQEVEKLVNLGLMNKQTAEAVNRMNAIEAGLIKKPSGGGGSRRTTEQREEENFLERLNAVRARATGYTRNFMQSIQDLDRAKKTLNMTEAEYNELLLGLIQTQPIYKERVKELEKEEAELKKTQEERSEVLQFIAESVTEVSEASKFYGSFLDRLNEAELKGLITIEEVTAALNRYARARINAANAEATQLGNDRQSEFTRAQEDFGFDRATFGMTETDRNIAMAQRDNNRRLLEDFKALDKKGGDPAVIQAEKERLQSINDQNNALVAQQEQLKKVQDEAGKLADIFSTAFDDLIFGGKSFEEVLGNLEKGIVDLVTEILILEPLKASLRGVFGSMGGGGGIEGLIGSAASSFIGGFFAEGGRPPLGKISVVGEKGPELFVPDTSGTIVPNRMLQGMQQAAPTINLVQNFTIQGHSADRSTQAQVAASALQGAQVAMSRDM